MNFELPFAEDINYFKTGEGAPDKNLADAQELIESIGGRLIGSGFGIGGHGDAFMMAFQVGQDRFRVIFPVLPLKYPGVTEKQRSANKKAARIQASRLLFYDVKAKVLTARILGARVAFFSYILLPDGRSATEVNLPELSEHLPLMLKG